jgi:hypothetical protein
VAKKQLVADAGWATLVRHHACLNSSAINQLSDTPCSRGCPALYLCGYCRCCDYPVTDSRAESGHPVELLPNARTEAMLREKGYVVSVADYESDSGSVEVQQIYVNKYPRESNRLATHMPYYLNECTPVLRAQPTATLKIASAPEDVLRAIFIAAFELWWDLTLYNRWEALPAHALPDARSPPQTGVCGAP